MLDAGLHHLLFLGQANRLYGLEPQNLVAPLRTWRMLWVLKHSCIHSDVDAELASVDIGMEVCWLAFLFIHVGADHDALRNFDTNSLDKMHQLVRDHVETSFP